MPADSPRFSPEHFFNTVNAYFRTAAVKAGIELNLFSEIGESGNTSEAIARACGASSRGVRILCDYLVYIGFLCKDADGYYMTREMAAFLDKRSPGYIGGTIEFFLSPLVTNAFADLASTIRGGPSDNGAMAPDHPQWVKFAEAMAPMMLLPSYLLAELIDKNPNNPIKLLDIAAGHGQFGIAFAQRNKKAMVTAIDWPNVLSVAQKKAAEAGVLHQMELVSGDAFQVGFGSGYDVVLFANFLHHFDRASCEKLLEKAHAALKDGGRVVIFEFIANEDKISPPMAATFAMMMLGTTPSGEVYTLSDIKRMSDNTGFATSELCSLEPALESVVVLTK